MENYLAEAFKKMSLLEDDFNLSASSNDDILDLRDIVADDVEEIEEEPIYDTNAADDSELSDNYVGKVILECNCCHSRIYKDKDSVFVDDDAEASNTNEECPICNTTSGYTVIGKIEPFNAQRDIEKESEEEDDDTEVEKDTEVDEAYSLDDRIKRKHLKIKESVEYDRIKSEYSEDVNKVENAGFELIDESDGFIYPVAVKNIDRDNFMYIVFPGVYKELGTPVDKFMLRKVDADGNDRVIQESNNIDFILLRADSVFNTESNKSLKESAMKEYRYWYETMDGNKGEHTVQAMDAEEADDAFEEWFDTEFGYENLASAGWLEDYDESLKESPQYVIKSDYYKANPYSKEYSNKSGKSAGYLGAGGRSWVALDSNMIMKFDSKEDAEAAKEKYVYAKYKPKVVEYTFEESLKEDFKDVSITTDDSHMEMTSDENGKVVISTEPIKKEDDAAIPPDDIEAPMNGEEEIVPLDAEDEQNIDDNVEETEEEAEESDDSKDQEEEVSEESDDTEYVEESLGVDDLDHNKFDSLCETFLNRIYSNVKSFRTTEIVEDNNFNIKGVINFKSGKSKPTSFVFTEARKGSCNNLFLTGYNKTFSESQKAFKLRCKLNESFATPVKMTYKFKVNKLNESMNDTIISGKVRVR